MFHLCSYLSGKRGRRAVPLRTDRSHLLHWPEHGRMKRRPRCRPDTWSDRCHQTEWQMPGNPDLIPRQRERAFMKQNNYTKVVFILVLRGIYLSQFALEQRQITGRREDDVLTRREGVDKPQTSGLGLWYESPQLSWEEGETTQWDGAADIKEKKHDYDF